MSDLPTNLVIRNGIVVIAKSGKVPIFPNKLEGEVVNVVPHEDVLRLMQGVGYP